MLNSSIRRLTIQQRNILVIALLLVIAGVWILSKPAEIPEKKVTFERAPVRAEKQQQPTSTSDNKSRTLHYNKDYPYLTRDYARTMAKQYLDEAMAMTEDQYAELRKKNPSFPSTLEARQKMLQSKVDKYSAMSEEEWLEELDSLVPPIQRIPLEAGVVSNKLETPNAHPAFKLLRDPKSNVKSNTPPNTQ